MPFVSRPLFIRPHKMPSVISPLPRSLHSEVFPDPRLGRAPSPTPPSSTLSILFTSSGPEFRRSAIPLGSLSDLIRSRRHAFKARYQRNDYYDSLVVLANHFRECTHLYAAYNLP